MNPDGSIRSGKKRKAHDNVATSYMGLPVGAPTALVAHARCEPCPLLVGLPFDSASRLCPSTLPFDSAFPSALGLSLSTVPFQFAFQTCLVNDTLCA